MGELNVIAIVTVTALGSVEEFTTEPSVAEQELGS